jgi:hypothetical protein
LVTNTGDAPSSGKVTIVDELPEGLEAAPGVTAEDELIAARGGGTANFGEHCEEAGNGDVSCSYAPVVPPDDTLILRFPVRVTASVPGSVINVVRVSGGGASASTAVQTPTRISEDASKAKAEEVFGFSPGGTATALSSVQAGAHADVTAAGAFNTENTIGATVGNAKNITYDLPAGFAGDLIDTPACEAKLFLQEEWVLLHSM